MIIATIKYHWTVVSNTFNSNGNVYINEPEWWGIGWNDLKSVAIGRLASSLLHISIGAEWTQVSLLTARSGVLFFFSFTIYHKEKVTMLCAWNSLLVIVQRQRIVAQRTTCAVRVICIRTRTPQDSSMMKKRNSALCRARFYPANQKFRLLFCIRNQWLMISIPPLLFFVINQWPIRFRRLQ